MPCEVDAWEAPGQVRHGISKVCRRGGASLGSGRIDRRQRRDSGLTGLCWAGLDLAGLDLAGQVGNAQKQTDVPMVAIKKKLGLSDLEVSRQRQMRLWLSVLVRGCSSCACGRHSE